MTKLRLAAVALIGAAVFGLWPAAASAHPLGNFTINRYDGLTIGIDTARVDHVLDMAEIPALQARQQIDLDDDGAVADTEGAAWAEGTCRATANELSLALGGRAIPLEPTALGLTFPAGQAGLLTLRLVCHYEARYEALSAPVAVEFRDGTYAGRLGWREIVVGGDGTTIDGTAELATGSSDRLRAYPAATAAGRAQEAASFTVMPGGPAAPAWMPTDAVPFGSSPREIMSGRAGSAAAPFGGAAELPAELAAILQAQELTLPTILASLLIAMLLGALHAASPGHGKTLMAAYLVGSRGTARHAVGLGMTVTVSHTIGVLALGGLVLFAGALVPSERLLPILALASGLVVTGLGAVLLAQRLRPGRQPAVAHDEDHDDGHDHGDGDGWHAHGPMRHTHLPQRDDPLRRRNLVALGLVGGLVPSASAVLILVAAISAGRPAFGMVLAAAFGMGMAVVLVGVGLLFVRARSLVERLPSAARLEPVFARLPLATAALFLLIGGTITVQAVAQLR